MGKRFLIQHDREICTVWPCHNRQSVIEHHEFNIHCSFAAGISTRLTFFLSGRTAARGSFASSIHSTRPSKYLCSGQMNSAAKRRPEFPKARATCDFSQVPSFLRVLMILLGSFLDSIRCCSTSNNTGAKGRISQTTRHAKTSEYIFQIISFKSYLNSSLKSFLCFVLTSGIICHCKEQGLALAMLKRLPGSGNSLSPTWHVAQCQAQSCYEKCQMTKNAKMWF